MKLACLILTMGAFSWGCAQSFTICTTSTECGDGVCFDGICAERSAECSTSSDCGAGVRCILPTCGGSASSGLTGLCADSLAGDIFDARDCVCNPAGAEMPCDTTSPTRGLADRTIPAPETLPDTTYVYVVSWISLPQATTDPDGDGPLRAQAAGFNVDGLDSGNGSIAIEANCEEVSPDYVAITDPDHVGVDNALQSLLGLIEGFLDPADCPGMTTEGCLDAKLQEQVTSGSFLLLMEVSNVNDFVYDSSVTLQLHLGATVDGMPPRVGGDGRLEPGQAFISVGPDGVAGTDDDGMALGPPVEGDIFAGRLAARAEELPLIINAGGFALRLLITQTQIRFDISDTALGNGAIGGVVTVDAIVGAVAELMPDLEETVRTVIEGIADVDPSSDIPTICTAMSLGILFDGTTATLN